MTRRPGGNALPTTATKEPRVDPGAQWQSPDHGNDRRSADALARCRPRGTRQCGWRLPLDGTPPQRRSPPPGSHPAPLPPPEPPPVQHPAPLPPPYPPPELGAGESDDENWTPYHLSTPSVATVAPAATARATSPPQQPPPNTPEARRPPKPPPHHRRRTPGDVAPRLHRSPVQPNPHRRFPNA